MEAETVLEMVNITKKFGDFVANDNISLQLKKGEILAILGENGAGKTTLMRTLYGIYHPDGGHILIHGQKHKIQSPKDAIALKIGMVNQHFLLVDNFTVAENVVLGSEPGWFFKRSKSYVKKVMELANKYELPIRPHLKAEDCEVGLQQKIEILKVLYRDAEILIFDEPTAVLSPPEIEEFLLILRGLVNKGKSIILITHKLKEIKKSADRCVVIRQGKVIETVDVATADESKLAFAMVGRKVNFRMDKSPCHNRGTLLKVENLVVNSTDKIPRVNNLNFELKAGEIFGIAGVEGNGQSELAEALAGLRAVQSGKISRYYPNARSVETSFVDLTHKNALHFFRAGIYNVPEDRQKRGLILDYTITENMVLENIDQKPYSHKGLIHWKLIEQLTTKLVRQFQVYPNKTNIKASHLSGGNQQKVILAREINYKPDVLIVAQPTRGLDVGIIEFIHKQLVQLRDEGCAILLLSYELDEIFNVSDQVGVLYKGQFQKIMPVEQANEYNVGRLMMGLEA